MKQQQKTNPDTKQQQQNHLSGPQMFACMADHSSVIDPVLEERSSVIEPSMCVAPVCTEERNA